MQRFELIVAVVPNVRTFCDEYRLTLIPQGGRAMQVGVTHDIDLMRTFGRAYDRIIGETAATLLMQLAPAIGTAFQRERARPQDTHSYATVALGEYPSRDSLRHDFMFQNLPPVEPAPDPLTTLV